ncbi:hypothetical protein OH76DRAFT_310928 [Lentinus brumalis]|uniref:Uncharacterized protein n=1 Tax=Lentinus brumalis TaxID=2498619 RepID=A0A371CK67_9APHY|nr:hypothetical protein OH76DRAFT_310928 [Polyporus brumalis]
MSDDTVYIGCIGVFYSPRLRVGIDNCLQAIIGSYAAPDSGRHYIRSSISPPCGLHGVSHSSSPSRLCYHHCHEPKLPRRSARKNQRRLARGWMFHHRHRLHISATHYRRNPIRVLLRPAACRDFPSPSTDEICPKGYVPGPDPARAGKPFGRIRWQLSSLSGMS